LYTPLFLRASILRLCPIQYLGGQQCVLYKGKGVRSKHSSSRDVLLGDCDMKLYHKAVRRAAIPSFVKLTNSTQYSVHGSTAVAHVHLKAFTGIAEAHGLSCSLIFADISTAFASMQRFIVFPDSAFLESYKSQLKSVGFTDDAICGIVLLVRAHPWHEVGGNNHLWELIHDLHSGTWATHELLAGCINTSSGCTAGTALADLAFNVSMCMISGQVRSELDAAGLI
jgi:hypothetical protein